MKYVAIPVPRPRHVSNAEASRSSVLVKSESGMRGSLGVGPALSVEQTGVIERAEAGTLGPIPALLDDLSVDDLLFVPALNKPGIFHASHELVERGPALAGALLFEGLT